MSDPRKHHFVAQPYQRGFARRKGKSFQVRVLNKTSGEGGIRNVRDAFSQRDWNTLKTEDGLKEFGVERVLAEYIDAEAASALEATRKHQFPLSRPEPGSPRHVHTNAMLLQAMFSSVQEAAEKLDMRTWTLARFDSPCLFTGEHPFVHINPSGESIGFGVVTAEQLYLPAPSTELEMLIGQLVPAGALRAWRRRRKVR